MPPKYLETVDKRKNFVKFLLCFYFWNLFSFIVEVLFRPRCDESQRVSIPPLLSNIQRNDEIPFIPSHWAWIHHYTIFKHFSQLFFFEKMWSNLRRQMIRWSITSALPNYWLGHKEGRKVGFCQILYIWHLFKMCLMYFLCMSSHSFCASTRGWHFTQKEMMSGPQIFGRNLFFYPKLIPETVNFEMGFFWRMTGSKVEDTSPLLSYYSDKLTCFVWRYRASRQNIQLMPS